MKIEAKKMEATQIVVYVEKDYALALIAIFNNCRENCSILNVSNNSGNSIYVTVTPNAKDNAIKWLEQFGTIESVEKVLALVIDTDLIDIDYDIDEYYDLIIAVD